MNREIKFRGKRLDNGEWVCGNLVTSHDALDFWGNIIIPQRDANLYSQKETYGADLGIENWHRVDPETVGQYTGLKDTNDVEIYEGDVVKSHHYSNGVKKRIVGIVMFGFCGWVIAGVKQYVWDSATLTSACEVIGNKWDDSSLLLGDKQDDS